jgi:hypothetical protein
MECSSEALPQHAHLQLIVSQTETCRTNQATATVAIQTHGHPAIQNHHGSTALPSSVLVGCWYVQPQAALGTQHWSTPPYVRRKQEDTAA